MKFKNLFLFLILLVIFISACNSTTSPQTPKSTFQPVAWLSGQPGSVNFTPAEGNGPFQCALTAGTLPAGFILNNCVISGTAQVLAGGTTKSISPPFTITITNAAGQRQNLEYNILTVASLPEIIFNEPGTCIVKQKCDVNLIAQVNGGIPPYHFQSDTFRQGAPPMGMIVDVNGVLTGKPTRKGTYTFGVCVVDVVAASKCGQTSVFVIDKEEAEEIISYGESSGLCSSNTDCTNFATNNCDAPGNVRCGKDGLCHCCLTLCSGGENCKCIGCSTGCGGGTYCEGGVCVFEAGGNPSSEQTTDLGIIPKEESKDVPESWTGILTGSEDKNTYCVEGKFSYNFNVKFKIPRNLVSAMQGKGKHIYSDDEDNSGSVSGTATVASQTLTSKYHPDCKLAGGTLTDTQIKIRTSGFSYEGDEPEIAIESPNYQNFIPSKVILDGNDVTPGFGSLILKPTSVSGTTISGTWGTGQFGESATVPHGTFTLTKQ